MRYFTIDTLGDLHDEHLCVLHTMPSPIGAEYISLVRGHPTSHLDLSTLTMATSPETQGRELQDLVGNTTNFLIGSPRLVEVLRARDRGPTEYVGFTLLDEDQRVLSEDLSFVNPLTVLDALHRDASDILYFKETQRIIKVRKAVLDARALHDAPGLFRVEHDRAKYVVDEPTGEALRANCTNVRLNPIEVAGSDR